MINKLIRYFRDEKVWEKVSKQGGDKTPFLGVPGES